MSGGDDNGMMPEAYLGNETGYIKHQLLKNYLKKLIMIIGMSAKKLGISELCYVDCFAGPWRDESDDLSSTSIAISLDILEECLTELKKHDQSVKMRALYVENDEQAFARLDSYLESRSTNNPHFSAERLHGDFVELRPKILEWCGNEAFVFFFIDPKNWEPVSINILAKLLARPRSEFIITFMYDFLNRFIEWEKLHDQMSLLLGQLPDLKGLSSSDREERILDIYRENLKSKITSNAGWPARSAYLRVLDRQKERTKYHLVYLTTHPRGIIEFMTISEKVEVVQKQVRGTTKLSEEEKKSGMSDLFRDDENCFQGAEDVQDAMVAELAWLSRITECPKIFDEKIFAEIIEETNLTPSDLQKALGKLIKENRVINLDEKGKRRSKFLHYEKHERLRLSPEVL